MEGLQLKVTDMYYNMYSPLERIASREEYLHYLAWDVTLSGFIQGSGIDPWAPKIMDVLKKQENLLLIINVHFVKV